MVLREHDGFQLVSVHDPLADRQRGFSVWGWATGIGDAERAVSAHYPFLLARADGATRFYGVDSQIICLAPSGAMAEVRAAGRAEKDFRHLDSLLAFEWDYSILQEL